MRQYADVVFTASNVLDSGPPGQPLIVMWHRTYSASTVTRINSWKLGKAARRPMSRKKKQKMPQRRQIMFGVPQDILTFRLNVFSALTYFTS